MNPNDLAAELAADMATGLARWTVSRGLLMCPECGDVKVAREKLETTRYPIGTVHTERTIRCMACGAEADE